MKDTPSAGSEVHRLQMLLETVRLLNSTLELRELTRIILEVVRGEISVERVSVFIVDRDRNMLQALVAQEVEGRGLSVPVGVGIAGTVATTGEVLDVRDAYADPRFDRRVDGELDHYTNDLFALPVCNRRGETVGVLELVNRLRPISPTDREFLLGISVYIGLALENAWLHSQVCLKEHLEEPEPIETPEQIGETDLSDAFLGVAGEINNPLTFAMGYLELARDRSELPAQMRTYLEEVAKDITETTAAARKLQEFVKGRKQEVAPMYLGNALKQLSELRTHEWARQNIKATLIIEAAPPVSAHEDEIRLVLSYLVKNAEDAVLRSGQNRELRLHLWGTDQEVHVSIFDSGPVTVSALPLRLLESFLAANSERSSTALGLAIANSIVRHYNGQIRFESEPGKGTTFILKLPALQGAFSNPNEIS